MKEQLIINKSWIEKISTNKWFVFLFCASFSFLFVLLLDFASPLYGAEKCDSSVFQLMGLALLHGKIPYKDLFDHKGPLLYFIEAFGQYLYPGKWGLFALQFVALCAETCLWYKISKYFTSATKSLFVVLLCLFSYKTVSMGEFGNLTEDWNCLFITMAVYSVICVCFDKSKKTNIHYLLIGCCFACAFFIRPNDAVAYIGGLIIGMLYLVWKDTSFKSIICNILFIILGSSIVTLPILIFYAHYNAINDLWYGLIVYNSIYSGGLFNLISNCISNPKIHYIPIIIASGSMTYLLDKRLFHILLPTYILGYIFLGSRVYPHYILVWVPIICLFLWIAVLNVKQYVPVILSITIFFSMPYFDTLNPLKTPIRWYGEMKRSFRNAPHQNAFYCRADLLFSELSKDEKEHIWNYNLSWNENGYTFGVLWRCNIVPCNRIPMVFLSDVDSTLYKDMNLVSSQPDYILFSVKDIKPKNYSKTDSLFMLTDYHIVSSCENPDLILYKKNE